MTHTKLAYLCFFMFILFIMISNIDRQKQTINIQNSRINLFEKRIEALQNEIKNIKNENTHLKKENATLLQIKTTNVFKKVSNIVDQHNLNNNTKIDKSLLLAIIKVESNFNPKAKNKYSGASGLCQFMPSTYNYIIKKYAIKDNGIFNIESNTLAGIYYLKELSSENKNIDFILKRYLGVYNNRYLSLIKTHKQNFSEIL